MADRRKFQKTVSRAVDQVLELTQLYEQSQERAARFAQRATRSEEQAARSERRAVISEQQAARFQLRAEVIECRARNAERKAERLQNKVERLERQLRESESTTEDDLEASLTCCVCKENRVNATRLPCGHAMFCADCLRKDDRRMKDRGKRSNCMLCRQPGTWCKIIL